MAGRPDLTANKALVRRFFEEGLGRGNLDLIDALVAPDAVMHNPLILDAPSSVRGSVEMLVTGAPQNIAAMIEASRDGPPGAHVSDVIATPERDDGSRGFAARPTE